MCRPGPHTSQVGLWPLTVDRGHLVLRKRVLFQWF